LPLSHDGLDYILSKHVAAAQTKCPSLGKKRVTPHVLRHYADPRTMPTASVPGYRMVPPGWANVYFERSSARHSPDKFRGS
jgi:hypothetical protein